MEDIHIAASKDSYIVPAVDFELATGRCVIEGESFLEETSKFYSPLVAWLKDYLKEAKTIEFIIKLKYFNTSTSKWILNMLNELKNFELSGGKPKVVWYYYKDDADMRDDIKEYIYGSHLNIDMQPFLE